MVGKERIQELGVRMNRMGFAHSFVFLLLTPVFFPSAPALGSVFGSPQTGGYAQSVDSLFFRRGALAAEPARRRYMTRVTAFCKQNG